MAQTVLVQDQALRAANDRLQELEGKVKDLESQAASGPRPGGFLGGLGSLFGGGAPPPRAPAPLLAAGTNRRHRRRAAGNSPRKATLRLVPRPARGAARAAVQAAAS